jgi:hypothetical protein
MSEQYTFKGGIKDGATVPDAFWILEVIDVCQHLATGKVINYRYKLNEEDRCWYLNEIYEESEGERE